MNNPNDLPIVLEFLAPNSTWNVRFDLSISPIPYVERWNGPDKQPTQKEIDTAEPLAVSAKLKEGLVDMAEKELIDRAVSKREYTKEELIDALVSTQEKTELALVKSKIEAGVYDTEEKVISASEWTKSQPS